MANKILHGILILSIILSPVWVVMMATSILPPTDTDMLTGIGILFAVGYGIPIIIVCGITSSIVNRKHKNAYKRSVYGYLIPAILACLYALYFIYRSEYIN
ncbi:MAG: hypothetical protein UW38_C0001G1077 [Candidatus Saccharibacteria bacterium GW2011_GWC2_44_17]|nr:MAG: hypothetical protein UW38_C0001G1077 [Candidatus Saccharibacteria bacterium GW2011_GWC2_44_17]OGL34181.1 MAG: hypothetical protein A3E20_04740 [Candidatus Saccharibacteria bacterium RIFCSPHIGHO2_12_FULL_47_16]